MAHPFTGGQFPQKPLGKSGAQLLPRLRGNKIHHVFPKQLLPGQRVQPAGCRVDIQHHPLWIFHKNSIGGVFEQLAESPLALPQRLLHLFPPRDVDMRAHQPLGPAMLIPRQAGPAAQHPDVSSGPGSQPELDFKSLPAILDAILMDLQ